MKYFLFLVFLFAIPLGILFFPSIIFYLTHPMEGTFKQQGWGISITDGQLVWDQANPQPQISAIIPFILEQGNQLHLIYDGKKASFPISGYLYPGAVLLEVGEEEVPSLTFFSEQNERTLLFQNCPTPLISSLFSMDLPQGVWNGSLYTQDDHHFSGRLVFCSENKVATFQWNQSPLSRFDCEGSLELLLPSSQNLPNGNFQVMWPDFEGTLGEVSLSGKVSSLSTESFHIILSHFSCEVSHLKQYACLILPHTLVSFFPHTGTLSQGTKESCIYFDKGKTNYQLCLNLSEGTLPLSIGVVTELECEVEYGSDASSIIIDRISGKWESPFLGSIDLSGFCQVNRGDPLPLFGFDFTLHKGRRERGRIAGHISCKDRIKHVILDKKKSHVLGWYPTQWSCFCQADGSLDVLKGELALSDPDEGSFSFQWIPERKEIEGLFSLSLTDNLPVKLQLKGCESSLSLAGAIMQGIDANVEVLFENDRWVIPFWGLRDEKSVMVRGDGIFSTNNRSLAGTIQNGRFSIPKLLEIFGYRSKLAQEMLPEWVDTVGEYHCQFTDSSYDWAIVLHSSGSKESVLKISPYHFEIERWSLLSPQHSIEIQDLCYQWGRKGGIMTIQSMIIEREPPSPWTYSHLAFNQLQFQKDRTHSWRGSGSLFFQKLNSDCPDWHPASGTVFFHLENDLWMIDQLKKCYSANKKVRFCLAPSFSPCWIDGSGKLHLALRLRPKSTWTPISRSKTLLMDGSFLKPNYRWTSHTTWPQDENP